MDAFPLSQQYGSDREASGSPERQPQAGTRADSAVYPVYVLYHILPTLKNNPSNRRNLNQEKGKKIREFFRRVFSVY
jgi:hypothetical protein